MVGESIAITGMGVVTSLGLDVHNVCVLRPRRVPIGAREGQHGLLSTRMAIAIGPWNGAMLWFVCWSAGRRSTSPCCGTQRRHLERPVPPAARWQSAWLSVLWRVVTHRQPTP
jgi:hypothetical protein